MEFFDCPKAFRWAATRPDAGAHAIKGYKPFVWSKETRGRQFLGPSSRLLFSIKIQTPSTMNKLEFKGSWNEVKGRLKQKYAQLTDDDLLFSEGKEDELLGRLQTKLGQTKQQVRDLIGAL